MKTLKILVLLLPALFLNANIGHAANDMKPSDANIGKGFVPKDGFIPDEATAIKVALAVLAPIYGEKIISSEHPFSATLAKDVWTVIGTVPKGHVGGAAEIRISKSSGKIIRVVHFK